MGVTIVPFCPGENETGNNLSGLLLLKASLLETNQHFVLKNKIHTGLRERSGGLHDIRQSSTLGS